MHIVIAPDAFKGSLSQIQATQIIAQAIHSVLPNLTTTEMPVADGGEGTLNTIVYATDKYRRQTLSVTGPLGNRIHIDVGIKGKDSAFIEVAQIVGLPLIPKHKRHPNHITTFGLGETINILLNKGVRKFTIGLGGTASIDGGLGMLIALGARMRNLYGETLGVFGEDLRHVSTIDVQGLDKRLKNCEFQIACDVDNPLLGKNGASHVFGPQKGVTDEELPILDDALKVYQQLLTYAMDLSPSSVSQKGAGAAGGLGFAFLMLGGRLVSGAKLVADVINLEEKIKHADLVMTGEGKSDEQTMAGKAPSYVAQLARKHNVRILLISGSIINQDVLNKYFDEMHEIVDELTNVQQAIALADVLLYKRVQNIFRRYL